jgi:hypothetical protein
MSNESSETWTDAEVQRVAIDGAYDERMLAREALAARAEIARLRAEVERLTRLRAFDTSTVPLPPGLALEHERLDAMWRQLVAERDHARAIVAAADALREAIRPYAPDEARAYDAARGTAMSDAGTVLEHDPDAGCAGCPYRHCDYEGWLAVFCGAAEGRDVESSGLAVPAPDWCPLRRGPVTVRRKAP